MSQTRLLLHLLDTSYDRKAWHGPNLKGAIRRVDESLAAWRPRPGRHNIWELVVHCAYWKYAAWRQLLGEKRGSFPLKGSNWFERPAKGSSWKEDVILLEQMHSALRAAVTRLSAADLARKPKGSKFTREELIAGIAAHDVYHAGQIRTIKRLR